MAVLLLNVLNGRGLATARRVHIEPMMARSPFGPPCAADNCLKPRWKDGWCAAHWYAHEARLSVRSEIESAPDSLAICEAIWNAS
jgi:hypothetical protein